jgi:type I restriction enzyme M protein
LKNEIKQREKALHVKTKTVIEGLDDAQVTDLLHKKWITALLAKLSTVPDELVHELIKEVKHLEAKYSTTLSDIDEQIRDTQTKLAGMIGQLTGNDTDMQGIAALTRMFGGK